MPIEHESEDLLDAVFSDSDLAVETGFAADYAAPANYGSEAHWPPLTPMVTWTERLGWENYDLSTSDSEDVLWAKVDARQAANEPLPGAFLLARHIAQHGTEPLHYASDAYAQGVREGESFVESQGYDATTPVREILLETASWTFSLANQKLAKRVSRASTGVLLQSGFPPQVIEE
jgi:hypothetical protein